MTGFMGLGYMHITLLLDGMISGTLYRSITWNSYKPHSQAHSDACMFIILSGRSIARQHDEQVVSYGFQPIQLLNWRSCPVNPYHFSTSQSMKYAKCKWCLLKSTHTKMILSRSMNELTQTPSFIKFHSFNALCITCSVVYMCVCVHIYAPVCVHMLWILKITSECILDTYSMWLLIQLLMKSMPRM